MEVVKNLSDTTMLVSENGRHLIYKQIHFEDVPLFKKIIDINCDNLARVYKTIVHEDKFYIVQEYVPGRTILELHEENGDFSDEDIRNLIPQLCDALSALHAAGIVHRDVTYKNVIVTSDGRLKLTDFGISRIIKDNQNTDTQILGTHGFAAPEQFGFDQTSAQSDIYSAGVLMNYMLTGKLPNEEPAGGEYADIISRCVELSPENRYRSAAELKKEILSSGSLSFLFRNVHLKDIPGFRGNSLFVKLFAGMYYIASIVMVAIMFFGSINQGPVEMFCWSLPFVFWLLIPPFIIFNYKNWINKWEITRYSSPKKKIAVVIMLVLVCFVLGLLSSLPVV